MKVYRIVPTVTYMFTTKLNKSTIHTAMYHEYTYRHVLWIYIPPCIMNIHTAMYYEYTYRHVLWIYIPPCIMNIHTAMYYEYTYRHVLWIYIPPCTINIHTAMYYEYTYRHVFAALLWRHLFQISVISLKRIPVFGNKFFFCFYFLHFFNLLL